jgi:hypothetical protein
VTRLSVRVMRESASGDADEVPAAVQAMSDRLPRTVLRGLKLIWAKARTIGDVEEADWQCREVAIGDVASVRWTADHVGRLGEQALGVCQQCDVSCRRPSAIGFGFAFLRRRCRFPAGQFTASGCRAPIALTFSPSTRPIAGCRHPEFRRVTSGPFHRQGSARQPPRRQPGRPSHEVREIFSTR